MRTRTVLLASALFISGTSFAQSNGPIGAGATSCGEYLSHRALPPDRDVTIQWASGLIVGNLSAAGHYIPETLTVREVASRLDDYCSKHIEHQVVLAALTVARDYKAKQ